MLSVFDMFYVGIGPSSSHTIGPMRAANMFLAELNSAQLLEKVNAVTVDLFGSLAHTGAGHGTDNAIVVGLEGHTAETVDPTSVHLHLEATKKNKTILLDQKHKISFTPKNIVHLYDQQLPFHTNALRFYAYDSAKNLLLEKTYYSIGGGTVVEDGESREDALTNDSNNIHYPFSSSKELLALADKHQLKIHELMLANEKCLASEADIYSKLMHIAEVMHESIEAGSKKTGILAGGLGVRRRAAELNKKLQERAITPATDTISPSSIVSGVLCAVSVWALAVSEENAAGGRMVVAPTCGAAGVLPAVLRYYEKFCATEKDEQKVIEFLLTAAAIETLYKKEASISGAEVGCQGEVGVACSMAAAGLTAALGGDNKQIEKAAEIGIEHHLGLTCDPMGGLVQIPCIERNLVAANQAISIAHLVLTETNEDHIVSLDKAIQTMKQTGLDMNSKYKETALGGLAVNTPNC